MAKPNLTSIFTSSNQYSVLKLLKALCDAVDNIDYTDNTEFTNFKEQVNSAINSLEQSIMNNENAISDLNTVTGNNSTEINSIKNKISGINTDASGDVVVSKNLEVNGNVFTLNGKQWGIMPVCTNINNLITNKGYIIYSEKPNIFSPATNINVFKCKGIYLNESGNVYIFSYSPSADNISIENDTLYIKSNDAYTSFINSAFSMEFAQNEVSQIKNKQNKLYRHKIQLMAGSSADGSCRLEWISSNNLNCDSLEDLRTLLNNPGMDSYVASNPSGDLFGVVITPSTAQLKKVGTTSLLNITNVSDTVTSL